MNILKNRGIATLPTVIIIGMIVLTVVVSITSISLNELLISQGSSQSSGALFYAEGGVRDALTRIARNKNYTCSSTDCYSLDFADSGCTNSTDCAKISVSSGTGATGDPKIIVSKGIMKSGTRTLQVDVTLDNGATTDAAQKGEITGTVWQELTN